MAVLQPEGGFVLCERAIVNYVEAARGLGADVHAREPVVSWTPSAGGVEVRTGTATYGAKHLVLTAGPWTAALVPTLKALARPERQVMLWTEPLVAPFFQLDAFPVFNLDSPEGHFYGFPNFGRPASRSGNTITGVRRSIPIGWIATVTRKTRRCCARASDATSRTRTARRWR